MSDNENKSWKYSIEVPIGRRRKLFQTLLNLQVLKNTIDNSITHNVPADYHSEYNSNFCKSTISSDESDEIRRQRLMDKEPLYGGVTRTIYTQHFAEGLLKCQSKLNSNEPFRRNSVITLQDNDLKEPKY